jgi:hypothetical protein
MGSADVQITLIPPRDVYPYDQFYAMNAYRDPWDFSIYPRLYKHYDYVRIHVYPSKKMYFSLPKWQ